MTFEGQIKVTEPINGASYGGWGVKRDQILDPLKIKYQISDIRPQQKSIIRYHTPYKIQISYIKAINKGKYEQKRVKKAQFG